MSPEQVSSSLWPSLLHYKRSTEDFSDQGHTILERFSKIPDQLNGSWIILLWKNILKFSTRTFQWFVLMFVTHWKVISIVALLYAYYLSHPIVNFFDNVILKCDAEFILWPNYFIFLVGSEPLLVRLVPFLSALSDCITMYKDVGMNILCSLIPWFCYCNIRYLLFI